MQNLSPYLLAPVEWSPPSLGIAIVLIIIGLLLLRFVVKTTISIVKIAILVLIGVGAYLGFQTFL